MATRVSAPVSARVALNAYVRIAEAWQLDYGESRRLLGVSERTVYRWLKEGRREAAGRDVLERISHIVTIWEDLAALFGRGEIARTWVRRPNRDFGDEPPLKRMVRGNVADLVFVRSYLENARHGW